MAVVNVREVCHDNPPLPLRVQFDQISDQRTQGHKGPWPQSKSAIHLLPRIMDEQLFAVLVEECVDTLKVYMAEADKTCALLNEYKGKSLDLNARRRILDQRANENNAHQRYMRVRERLFEVVQLGYGSAGASTHA